MSKGISRCTIGIIIWVTCEKKLKSYCANGAKTYNFFIKVEKGQMILRLKANVTPCTTVLKGISRSTLGNNCEVTTKILIPHTLFYTPHGQTDAGDDDTP